MRRDFGRYKIAEELGRGAMGVVYRAFDPVLSRYVAIKAISRPYLEGLGVPAAEYYERFRREAEVAGGLSHPHIVKIFDLGPDYMVLELVEGQSLEAALRARIRLDAPHTLEMVSQLADALDCAHAQGIVHRDIKPANIMLRPDGSVTVMDFGLARIETSTLTAAGEILGSASYMAPEVVLGTPADAKSDIFSLGVVTYELLTGARPFAGPSITAILHQIVEEPPPSAHGANLALPPDYDDVFARVLAKQPSDRYQTAGEFAAELTLKKWADQDPVLKSLEQATEPAPSPPPGSEGPSLLEDLVPSEVAPASLERAPEEPAATTFIMQAPEPWAMAAASARLSSAQDAKTETTEEMEAPPRTPLRVQFSGQATWGPNSRHPKAVERDASLKKVLQPARSPEATLPASPVLAGDAKKPSRESATDLMPVPPPAPVPGPDDTAPLGVTLPPIPPKVRSSVPRTVSASAPPTADPSDSGLVAPRPVTTTPPTDPAALGPETSSLPIPRQTPARRLSPALLLGGGAAVLLLAGGTLTGLAYFFLKRASPPVQATPAAPAPQAPPATETPTPAPTVDDSSPATSDPAPVPQQSVPSPAAPSASPPTPAPEVAPRANKAAATLLVDSQPAGARVKVGGVSGTTPWRLALQPGLVTVVVEKDGFRPWRKRFRLSSGRTQQVTARLQAARSASSLTGVKPGDLVALASDVTPPRRLSGDSPSYPDQAQRQKLSGSVLLEFLVTENGEVKDSRVLESAGEVLDRTVIEAVSGWRYQPAVKAGVKVRVKQQARFTFTPR